MDLYIFCVVLGAAGMAAMALLGFTSSHSGGHGHDTSGHEMHGIGAHSHTAPGAHALPHGHVTHGQAVAHASTTHVHPDSWKSQAWSWLSPRVMFNFLVGFGATGLVIERLVGPILALPGVRERLQEQNVVAVTPIVGGQAIKGPAAKMLAELNLEVSPVAVARYYEGLLNSFVLDVVDDAMAGEIAGDGLRVVVTDTVMRSDADRARLAQEVLDLAGG